FLSQCFQSDDTIEHPARLALAIQHEQGRHREDAPADSSLRVFSSIDPNEAQMIFVEFAPQLFQYRRLLQSAGRTGWCRKLDDGWHTGFTVGQQRINLDIGPRTFLLAAHNQMIEGYAYHEKDEYEQRPFNHLISDLVNPESPMRFN